MTVVLLALAIVASTVDPRLSEPLRLLTELHDRDGRPIGAEYAMIVEGSLLTLTAEPMRPGLAGRYNVPSRTVAIAEGALVEDPRFVAAALAHELRHADDADLVELGLLPSDCNEIEARGFESQAQVARAFWPDELPTSTEFERELAGLVSVYEREGIDGIRVTLAQHPAYRELCEAT